VIDDPFEGAAVTEAAFVSAAHSDDDVARTAAVMREFFAQG